nr:MAG TPA: hypothetical protein [Caudoviricetes sp.]
MDDNFVSPVGKSALYHLKQVYDRETIKKSLISVHNITVPCIFTRLIKQ